VSFKTEPLKVSGSSYTKLAASLADGRSLVWYLTVQLFSNGFY